MNDLAAVIRQAIQDWPYPLSSDGLADFIAKRISEHIDGSNATGEG